MSERLSAAALIDLGEKIAEQAVHLDAAMHRLLSDLRRFDEAGRWHRQGFSSCAHWLSHRVGWDLGTARERCRVARALAGLPKVEAALASGTLSYSKARAITRVAKPATEPTLLAYAETSTASQLETICRKVHAVERRERDARATLPSEDERYVIAQPTSSGMVCVKAFLRPEEAALLMQVIQQAAKDCTRAVRDDDDDGSRGDGNHEKSGHGKDGRGKDGRGKTRRENGGGQGDGVIPSDIPAEDLAGGSDPFARPCPRPHSSRPCCSGEAPSTAPMGSWRSSRPTRAALARIDAPSS